MASRERGRTVASTTEKARINSLDESYSEQWRRHYCVRHREWHIATSSLVIDCGGDSGFGHIDSANEHEYGCSGGIHAPPTFRVSRHFSREEVPARNRRSVPR